MSHRYWNRDNFPTKETGKGWSKPLIYKEKEWQFRAMRVTVKRHVYLMLMIFMRPFGCNHSMGYLCLKVADPEQH